MHALAGTIGHDLILDEEARQKAKQESRTRTFGISTPSTATSYDAEAAREQERLKAAEYLKAREALVRSFAALDIDLTASLQVERIKSALEGLEHQARQYDGAPPTDRADFNFSDGVAAGLTLAVEQIKSVLP